MCLGKKHEDQTDTVVEKPLKERCSNLRDLRAEPSPLLRVCAKGCQEENSSFHPTQILQLGIGAMYQPPKNEKYGQDIRIS